MCLAQFRPSQDPFRRTTVKNPEEVLGMRQRSVLAQSSDWLI